jgi:hypothetical protein
MRGYLWSFLLIAGVCALLGERAAAAEAAAPESGFFAAAPDDQLHLDSSFGVWALSAHGTVGVRRLNADVDASFGDIVENLDLALMPGVQLTKSNWVLEFDGIWTELSDNKSFSPSRGIDINLTQGVLDTGIGYTILRTRIGDMPFTLTPEIGARLNYLKVEIEPANFSSREASRTWVDPWIGGRAVLGLTPKLNWRTEGNYGGFDVGCQRTWALASYLDWRMSERFTLNVGYRAMAWDYDLGNFKFDITYQGPWIGLTASWF